MNSESRVLTIHVPASALQENQLTQILTAHLISSIMTLPTTLASSVLQQHVNAALVNANMQSKFFFFFFVHQIIYMYIGMRERESRYFIF